MREPEATGDALFVEGDYAGAVTAYTAVIEAGRDISRALAHRSAAQAMGRYEVWS